MPKVVIIGAGLAGLECGYILAKQGFEVTILEHDAHIGGCLQSFRRGDTLFDTGFHYVGGLDEGQALHTIFQYFDLLRLPWQKMDEDCFDEVIIGDSHFPFAQGHERFVEQLSALFPYQRTQLKQYSEFLQQIGRTIFAPLQPDFQGNPYFQQSAYQWLCQTITDPLLRQVLSGTSLKMELLPSLPLYTFAQINNSFIQSAWRLQGGGQQIADSLRASIESMGGKVYTRSTVTRLIEHNGQITQVEINHQERIPAHYVISAIHPSSTIQLIDDCPAIRKIYRKRMTNMENTRGMFTANIILQPRQLPYRNTNLFIHPSNCDLWQGSTDSMLVHFYPPEDSSDSLCAMDILTPMSWQEVSQWADKPRGHRGDDYVAFKQEKTDELIRKAAQHIPDLDKAIARVYTSTPLSYAHYTLSPQGSAYGVRKDYNSALTAALSPRTPLPNLFLTGQSLNLHGILGVSMSAILSAKTLISTHSSSL